MQLSNQYTFDAAHQLKDHPGKCKNLHGHTYTLRVYVDDKVDSETNMVMDLIQLNAFVGKYVLSKLDHTFLNAVVDKRNPTLEKTVAWIWDTLHPKLPTLTRLMLQEGLNGGQVSYDGESES